MSHAPLFERDIGLSQRMLDDASKGMQAAEALLFHHSKPDAQLTAINFPRQENLLRETVSLLVGWKGMTAMLLRRMDAATVSANLQFERLFDANAGRQTEGFLRRRVHLGHAAPETIAAELVNLLGISVALERMLKQAKPLLVYHHHNCEAYLLQLVSRRRQVDVDLVAIDRSIVSLSSSPPHEPQTLSLSWRNSVSQAAPGDEHQILALDRQAVQVRDETLRSELETLQRMIADNEDFVEALNAGVAATNVMTAKLSLDIEQRIALLKATQVQSSGSMAGIPQPVQALIDGFDANSLAGHDLLVRKQRADEAFARRFEGPFRSSDGDAEDIDETGHPTESPQASI